MLRRLASVVLALAGAAATVATSPPIEPATAPLASPPSTVSVTLSREQPALRFTVTARATGSTPRSATVRAEVRVDDDGDPENDGLPAVDTGLLALTDDGGEPALPVDVDVDGDPALASVAEGTFAVTRAVEPALLADGVELVLAARLRPERAAARLTFVVVVEADVDPAVADTAEAPVLAVAVALRPDTPADDDADPAADPP
jgi:hypothetical protein